MSSTPSDASTIALELERGLARASASVRAAQVRVARRRAFERASIAAAGTAIATAVAVAISRRYGAGLTGAAAVAGVGVLACGVVVAGSLATSLREQAHLDEVAERLDLAAGNQNAIATALDLLQNGARSMWIDRAIAGGVSAATSFGLVRPVTAEAAPLRRRGLLALAGGAALIVLALFVPVGLLFPFLAVDPVRVETSLTSPKSDSQIPPRPSPVVAKRQDATETPAAASASRASASPDRSKQNAGRSDEASASANSASPGESSASAGKAGGQSSTQQPPQKSNVGDPQVGSPSAAMSDPKAMQAASFGSASPDAAQAKTTPAGGAGGNSADSKQSDAKSDPGAGQGASQSDSPSDKSGEGAGEGSGQNGKDSKEGQGSGQSMQSGEGTGGNGQGSGQSPPKKSRGVAPLMLGSRQPDLLQGRQLPGPDERTKLQVPPRPTGESPSPEATADSRQKAEPAVNNYRVPAAARRAVSQYFEQFHQDADAAARQP